jgi:peroxiredoxin
MPTDTSDLRDPQAVRSAPVGGRSRALLVGVVAAVVALVAAVGAGLVASRLTEDEGTALPEPEAEIRFLPEDDESGQPLVGEDRTGDAAPEAAFPMLDGGLATLADLRGTPVVVNFFASWCEPCKAEMPDFAEVHAELGAQVTFLGISLRDAEEDTRALLERTGVTYAIGRDPSGSLAEDFGVVNMPTTYFLDAEGRIVSAHAGALTADALRSQLAALTS